MRAAAFAAFALAACGAPPAPTAPAVTPARSADVEMAPLPPVTVLSRGRGESPEWSPCAAAAQFVFCRRSGHWLGGPGGEDVVVRLDVEGSAPRVFSQSELQWDSPEWQPRLVSDGVSVYWVTRSRIEKLPSDDGAPAVVHRFAEREMASYPDAVAIVGGEVWEQHIDGGRDGGPAQTTVIGTRFGGDLVDKAVTTGAAPWRRNFFVGKDVRAWLVGDAPELAVWRPLQRKDRGRVDSVIASVSIPALEDADDVPLVALDGEDVFFVAPTAEGYAVLSAGEDPRRPQALYAAKDSPDGLPTHDAAVNLVVDATHLYFLDPDWQGAEPGVRLLRLPREAKPEGPVTTMAVVEEMGQLWIHRGRVHMIGGVSGDIIRFNGPAAP